MKVIHLLKTVTPNDCLCAVRDLCLCPDANRQDNENKEKLEAKDRVEKILRGKKVI